MNGPCENTDRELWREREGDYYADSIHVTEEGAIGIDCGGTVFVMTLRDWHDLASGAIIPAPTPTSGNDEVEAMCERLSGSVLADFGLDGLGCDAVTLIRKQAAQIERVESANSSLHAQWDSEVKTLHAQIANLTDRLEMDYRDAQIAELQNELLQKATPKSAIAKEGK